MERHRTAAVSAVAAAAAAHPLVKACHGGVYVVCTVQELLRHGGGCSKVLRQTEERGQCLVVLVHCHPLRISIAPLRPR